MPPTEENLSLNTQNSWSFYEFISGVNTSELSNYDEFEELEDAKYPSLLVSKKRKKSTPFNTFNVQNAFLGLNQSHVPLVIFTLEAWHYEYIHGSEEATDKDFLVDLGLSLSAAIVSPWAVIPIAIYLGLTLWNIRATIQKNIVYNENRIRYLTALNQLTLTDIPNRNDKAKNLEQAFNTYHARLLNYNQMQLRVDPPKKFARAAFVFGVLFLSILPAGWPIIFITLICAAVATRADYVSLQTEINQDLEIKKLQWELIQRQEDEISRILKEKNITFDNTKNHEVKKQLDQCWLDTDQCITRIGMNSGYVPMTFFTTFGIHKLLMALDEYEILANILLFGIPLLACVIIGHYHANANAALYQFYAEEITNLKNKNEQLNSHIEILKKVIPNLGNTEDLLQPQSEFISRISTNSKESLKWFEAGKKIVRPTQFLALFGVLSSIAGMSVSGGLVIPILIFIVIAIVSIAMGYADYKTRQYKESLEKEINDLKDAQINLLYTKKSLLTQYTPPISCEAGTHVISISEIGENDSNSIYNTYATIT